MKLADVIKKPLVSEKSMGAVEDGRYTFVVDRAASKNQIKKAVETIFGVSVIRVRTTILKRKQKRLSNNRRMLQPAPVKKAIVELKKGEKLDIYES
ncbi:MAG: 50S ribosomal protein L23 [Candidatus Shapirobacteria bacterium]|nr:50S ribosomal protein L23 [Candidatus Shapirobacteria bacterium]MDD5073931.1 50S ribosomal protein L23 [Candidatus Shapirobacteria bacterium]MDD5481553.1 50S ribosomal protein L23 [Candidatus Shapirobacteria bacterium]